VRTHSLSCYCVYVDDIIIFLLSFLFLHCRFINKDIWAALGKASQASNQAISNIRTVKAFGAELMEIDKYQEKTAAALAKSVLDSTVSAGAYALTQYFDLGTSVLLLWYGGDLVLNGTDLTVGQLIKFQLFWNMVNSSYNSIASLINQFTRASAAAQRVFSLMDSMPDIDPTHGAMLERNKVRGGFVLEDVDFWYQMRESNKVLTNLSLTIKPGTVCALVGPSGGGKSTLVHLLLRFYDPRRGRILLDGVDLRDLNLVSLHQQTAIVAQDTELFQGTVFENIVYGLNPSEFDQERVEQAARLANAHDFIMSFEEKYETRVGQRGVRLSGGQKQRISIARAILRRSPILLLDEATSALDAESEASVQAALDNLISKGNCTVILVAHRLSTVVNAHQIAVIDKGRVVESGSHTELVARGGTYARLVARQMQKSANTLELGHTAASGAAASDVIDKLMEEDDSAGAATASPAAPAPAASATLPVKAE
jgi:ATP-binding cassette subfamily B protein